VVELHNGLLTAHSDGEGLGSEFRCELPLVQMPILTHAKRTSLRIKPNDDDASSARSHLSLIPTHNTPKPSPNPPTIHSPTSIAPTRPLYTIPPTPTSHPLSTIPPISRVLVVDDSRLSRKVPPLLCCICVFIPLLLCCTCVFIPLLLCCTCVFIPTPKPQPPNLLHTPINAPIPKQLHTYLPPIKPYQVLCRLLKNNGFRVEEAVDGVDCVEQMQKQGQAQGLEAVHMILMGT
jgi:hypothetical protein